MDANLGGLVIQDNLGTVLTGSNGDGYVMVWDETTLKFIAQAIPTDSTKLPLTGGTMSGAINMSGQNILGTGHLTMSPQTTINLGVYTATQEGVLTGGLGLPDKGKTWYNISSNQAKVWDGVTATTIGLTDHDLSLIHI